MSVVGESNKQMLFELLKSIGNDNKLVINEKELYNFINQRCGYFHTNRYEFGFGTDLNKTNKKIIDEGYNFIMSNQPRKNVQQLNNKPNNQNIMTKREIFEKGLENQEKQFNKMINPKKPKEIDFSDGSDDFPIQNLDQIINQTLADRQKELESITEKYSSNDKKKAEQWLNREGESAPKIKIEKNSNLKLDNAITVSHNKRVHFEVKENPKPNPKGLNNLFSKLKQKTFSKNENIISRLDTIISNQDKILEMLYNKSTKEN